MTKRAQLFTLAIALLFAASSEALARCGNWKCGMCAGREPGHRLSRRFIAVYGYQGIPSQYRQPWMNPQPTFPPAQTAFYQPQVVRPTPATSRPLPTTSQVVEIYHPTSNGGKFAPTPLEAVRLGLDLLEVVPTDLVVDLGCGDGRWLLEATKRGAEAIGVERDPRQVTIARGKGAIVFEADLAADFPYPPGSVFVMYLFDELLATVVPKIPSGARCCSYMHPPPPEYDSEMIKQGDHVFYFWRQP